MKFLSYENSNKNGDFSEALYLKNLRMSLLIQTINNCKKHRNLILHFILWKSQYISWQYIRWRSVFLSHNLVLEFFKQTK